MTSSVTDIEKLLKYAKDLYCKGDCNLEKYWPSNWRVTEKLLKDVGYENPQEYFICLDNSHPANYDIMDNKGSCCRFCGKHGAIKYYYLGLPQKIKLWCSDPTFCEKMSKFCNLVPLAGLYRPFPGNLSKNTLWPSRGYNTRSVFITAILDLLPMQMIVFSRPPTSYVFPYQLLLAAILSSFLLW